MRLPRFPLYSDSAAPRKWLPGRRLPVACAAAIALLAGAANAGDILRGGATTSARENSTARNNAGSEAAAAARTRAQDRLSRTTKAISDMRQLQEAARAAAGDGGVPNGLVINGLERYQPGDANFRWDGAGAPVQSGNDVTITQNLQQAILHWKTFNVGKNTQVNFDQSAGGADSGKWIAFNKVLGSVAPSQIRGKIKADGQVYIINQSGIIFGAGSQVNARTLVASTLPINDNLVKQGLLNNPDAQFLFSGLTVPGGSDGTLAFVPPAPVTPDGRIRDVVVETGASLTATVTQDGNGGRVMLVGPNVQNSGEISTPNGQTILAAGLQVGVQAHDGDDPSLRGLDVWVGAVGDYGGAVVNNGIVSAPTGSIWLGGKQIRQRGVVQATTSVALNGRIDIKASYGAVSNANYDNSGNAGFGGPIFLNQFTGDVIFAENSSTSILPEYSSDKTVPGSALPQRSHVELDGARVYFAPDSTLLVPNGRVTIRAGIWPYKDADGDRTTLVTNPLTGATTPEPGLGNYFSGPTQNFLFSSGQVYLDRGASLSVAGTTEVLVPLTQSILEVQFRGGELADSPLQRDGTLRGKSLNVDIRKTGEYDGRYWVGTPLGDVVGLAGLVGKNVSQLTTRGGDISISAGTSIVTQPGSELDVSGGYFRHGGGMVRTSRVRIGGQLVKIEDATPDRVYDEIYSGQSTQTHSKWGVTRTFKSALAPTGDYKEAPYVEGAAAGSLTLTAPGMAVDGTLRGTTIQGPRQRSENVGLSSLNLNFRSQKLDLALAQPYQTIRPTPPAITFASQSSQVAAGSFDFASDPSSPLPASRVAAVTLSPELYTTSGFGDITIDNTDGSVTVPADVTVTTQPSGSLSVTASTISIAGKIRSPGGSLQFKATNLTTEQLATPSAGPALLANANAGVFSLAPGAVLSTAGFIIDDRPNARAAGFVPLVIDGGSVSIESFSALLAPSSSIDVSGGVAASTSGSISYGDAGSISIKTGLDPTAPSVLGGQLILGSTLSGYSGAKGGSLEIQAMLIQIGTGRALPNGPATLTFPAFGARPETLQVVEPLVLAPEFFQQGGFTSYSLTGIGAGEYTAKGPDGELVFPPAVYVEPGTSITPVAESLRAVKFPGRGGDLSVTRVLLPEGQRKAVSLSMQALGSDDLFTLDRLEARADIVIGQGASIQTDAGA
ncbi:MAG: filamentous hemagglutinin N-terminal domain-containing protein, partial [Terrimicrobiaceae bacterium]